MVGKSLSHYKILEELGRGGMGIVYKAEDTKLDRTVAIKVLPSAALASEDDRARFYREARAAAQLNHANICHVYEIDESVPEGSKDDDLRPFISMEYIEGETLSDRIQKGPLKLEEAVRIASQIASGLEAAHEKDIVHRDLKSQNVMLTAKGEAKILDFGLAQTAASTKLTRMGSTLGTVAYMSPEQAQGAAVNNRTDIWSLGVVLYEMIAGVSPFPGEYDKAIIYGILNQDPAPLTSLRTGVPMGLEWIVSKCLAKSKEDRYQTATDLIVDLRNVDLATTSMSRISSSRSVPPSQTRLPLVRNSVARVGASTLLALVLLLVGYYFGTSNTQGIAPLDARLEIRLPGIKLVHSPKLSPTRAYISFVGTDSSNATKVFLYHVQSGEITGIDGTNNANEVGASFSPDGDMIAMTLPDGIYILNLPAGQPRKIKSNPYSHEAWLDNRTLYVIDFDQTAPITGTLLLDVETGDISELAYPDTTDGLGNRLMLSQNVKGTDKHVGHRQAYSGLDETKNALAIYDESDDELVTGDTGFLNFDIADDEVITFQSNDDYGDIVWSRYDADRARLIGSTQLIKETGHWSAWSVADDGSLLLAEHTVDLMHSSPRTFFSIDLDNRTITRLTQDVSEGIQKTRPLISPNNDRIAYILEGRSELDELIVFDKETGVEYPVGSGNRNQASWHPDGDMIYYDTFADGQTEIYLTELSAGSVPTLILENAAHPEPSHDGTFLFAVQLKTASDDLDRLIRLDIATNEVVTVDSTTGIFNRPRVSNDNSHIVYRERTISGQDNIYVSTISGERKAVVVQGVYLRNQTWSPDDSTIYYFSTGMIYRINVDAGSSKRPVSQPQPIFYGLSFAENFDTSPITNSLVISARRVYWNKPPHEDATLIWHQGWLQSIKSSE